MKRSFRATVLLAAGACASTIALTTVRAQTTDPALNALVKKGILTEQEAKDALADPQTQTKARAANEISVGWKDGLSFQSGDGKFKGKLGGRIHLDAMASTEDDAVETLVGDIPAGVEFRRARLSFEGEFGLVTPLFFKVELDFAPATTEFKDVYVGIDKVPGIGRVTAGHFREPMGLEMLTSSRFLTFIERSAVTEAFTPDRNLGAMMSGARAGERITYALGVFTETDPLGRQATIDGNYRVTGRLTGVPWYDEEAKGSRLLHLGASGSFIDSSGDVARFRTRPEAHLAPRFVDTGAVLSGVDHAWLGNLEAALVVGSLSAQAEYYHSVVSSAVGSPTYQGYYVFGSWFITGEHRVFRRSTAAFERLVPRHNFNLAEGGLGAWELALRYSEVDLNDERLDGGRLNDITIGLNWYWHPNAKLQFNYVNARVDRGSVDGTAHLFQGRFALDF